MAAPKEQAAPAKSAKPSIFARAPKRKATKKGKEAASTATDASTGQGDPQTNGADTTHPQPTEATPSQPIDAAPIPPTTTTTPTTPTHDGLEGVDKPGGATATASTSSESGQVPIPSQQDPSTPTPAEPASAEATAPVTQTTPSTPNPVHDDQADETDREKEKDKGSLSTTLTGTQHTRLTSKGAQTASDGAHSNTTAQPSTPQPTGKQKVAAASRPRVSFLSRLVHVLVPCVGPSRPTFDTDGELASADTNASAPGLREKQALDADTKAPSQPAAPSEPSAHPATMTVPSTSAPSAPSADTATLQPLNVTLPTPSPGTADKSVDVVVPPSPSKILPESETGGVTSSAVVPPGSTADEVTQLRAQQHHESSSGDESDGTSFTEDEDVEEGAAIDEVEDDEDRLILNGGAGIPVGPDGVLRPLLPPIAPHHAGRKCLVLDLDETLVHSSFKSIQQADYVVPVEIEYHWHNVYVIKRPGVDNFLKKMGEIYEVVVFTASLSKYADPVLDKLDINHVVAHRLFRESCYNHKGNYVKDLSQLGRPIADTIILDNSPASYIFHPNNAVPVSSWFNDPHDTELTDLCPFLGDLGTVDDVRGVLDGGL